MFESTEIEALDAQLERLVATAAPDLLAVKGIGAETAGAKVRLVVRDRGPGMSPELLAAPGQPFTIDGSALTRKRDGLGLGLAIARLAAERHDGQLLLQPRPGGGIEAALELPTA